MEIKDGRKTILLGGGAAYWILIILVERFVCNWCQVISHFNNVSIVD